MIRSLVPVVMVVCALPAMGAPKVLAVATGDCRQPELLSGMTTFTAELRNRWQDELFSPDVVLDLTRPRPSRGLDDVKRQVESAKTLFYGGQHDRSLELVHTALSELEKVPASAAAWPIAIDAYLVLAQATKALDRKSESNEAFKHILRIEPTYKLDTDFFTPSTITAFEGLRREVQKSKKQLVQIQSTPSGADVFLEGRQVGKTPFKQELPLGTYRVAVALGESVSFPRTLSVPKDSVLHVDLAFEGALSSRAPICLQGENGESLAQKLAITVGAERVVVFWNDRQDGPPFYKAFLAKVGGTRERDAGVEGQQRLDQLASFIVTGAPSLPSVAPKTAAVPLRAEPVVVAAPKLAKTVVEPTVMQAPEVVAQPSAPMSTGRIVSYSLMGVGAACIIGGAIAYSTGAADRTTLSTLTSNGKLPPPSDPGFQQARDLIPKIDLNQRLSFGLIGAGIGAALAGTLGFFLLPKSVDSVALIPTSDGAFFAATGHF